MSNVLIRVQDPSGRVEDRWFAWGVYHVGREGCDIVLGDPNVSGRHARLDVQPGRVVITDVGSTNGTFDAVGNRIGAPHLMQPHQSVRLGGSTLTLLQATVTQGGTQVMPQMGSAGPTPPPGRAPQMGSTGPTPPPGSVPQMGVAASARPPGGALHAGSGAANIPVFRQQPVVVLILGFVTCGLYMIYWNMKVANVLNAVVGRELIAPTVAGIAGCCGPLNAYFFYLAGGALGAVGRRIGREEELKSKAVLLLVLGLFFAPVAAMIVQGHINEMYDGS